MRAGLNTTPRFDDDEKNTVVISDGNRVNTTDAVSRLDDDETGVNTVQGNPNAAGQRLREFNLINEAGVYRLIFTSRKPEAEAFKRWLVHDSIPETAA